MRGERTEGMKSFIGMVIILSLIFCGISFAETPQEEGSRKLSSVMATQVNNYEHLVAASINGLNDHEGTPDGLIVLVGGIIECCG